MEQQMTLGKRIAMLRKNQGLTQEQLGEKLGVSAQAVSKWENDIACPDITMLPLLADVFGVTTDELLGLKPIDSHVVILDKEPEEEKGGKPRASLEFEMGNIGRWGGICCCIMAILICVMLILRGTTSLFNRPDVNVWNYIWPIAVFSLGLGVVRKNPVFGSALMAVGAYEFIWFGWGVPFEIKWYVILLVLAIACLIKILFDHILGKKRRSNPCVSGGENPRRRAEYSTEGNYLKAELSFGNNTVGYPNDTLTGMEVETNFGDQKIDLTGVKTFADNPVLKIDVNFGNLVVYLPSCVQVNRSLDTAFGAMQLKGSPSPDADQMAYIKGDVDFGNLEIRYPNA